MTNDIPFEKLQELYNAFEEKNNIVNLLNK